MRRYTRLTLAEREEISRALAASRSLRRIAHQLRRSPSAISRELRRTGKRRLRAQAAWMRACTCSSRRRKSSTEGTRVTVAQRRKERQRGGRVRVDSHYMLPNDT